MSDWLGIHATDGTDQESRFPQPLADGYFRLDEMSFEDLLALSAEFASRLHFYSTAKAGSLSSVRELARARDGTWADLFAGDELVIMAQILSTDVRRLRTSFLEQLHAGPRKATEFIYSLARMLDTWLRGLAGVDHPSAAALASRVAAVIQKSAAPELSRVREYRQHVEVPFDAAAWSLAPFDPAWREIHHSPVHVPEAPPEKRRAWERTFLESAADSFIHAIAYLQSLMPRYMQDSLVSRRHDPAVGLFIAFLRLFEKAQARMNTLTQRHLDFYYEQVLGAVPRPPVPDSAWLVLQADPVASSVHIARGTPFSAGNDELDREIVYTAANDIVINDARVRALATLCLERDALISPEKELGFITRARIHRFAAVESRESAWPIFGAETKETCLETGEDAEIGFAVASAALFLHEGSRTVTLDFDFADRTSIDGTASILLADLFAHHRNLSDDEIQAAVANIFVRYLLGHPELLALQREVSVTEFTARMVSAITAQSIRNLIQEGAPDKLYDMFLIQVLENAATPDMFFRVFGMILRRNLLSHYPGQRERLSAGDKTRIEAKAEALLAGTPDEISLIQIRDILAQSRGTLLSRLLKRAWAIRLTTAGGWHDVESYVLGPSPVIEERGNLGLRCSLFLNADVDPIVGCDPAVHGAHWNTPLPLIRFQLNPLSVFYHYSLFEGLHLSAVHIETRVEGIKTFTVYNNEGQLDPSKPFLPFGAFPARNAYLIVGNPEMARKNVAQARLHIEWGGVPTEYGGFRTYYRGYDMPFRNDVFQVDVSVLRDGEWYPQDRNRRERWALFESREGEVVSESRVIDLDAVRYLKPIPAPRFDEEFRYDLRARSGFINFTLVAPESAFGHKDHSALMSRALTENAKLKRPARLPNPPYTPTINRLTMDYVARDVIAIASDPNAASSFGQQVYQIHPYGVRTVYPNTEDTAPTLLPTYHYEGNLFIGLQAERIQGVLTLFFDLAPDSTQEPAEDGSQPTISWFYLASNRWHILDRPRVLSDTTYGFLRSGIVTLDLPEELTTDNAVMPPGLFWLCAAASTNLKSFPSLYGVYAHGLKVTRRLGPGDPGYPGVPLPEGRIRRPLASIPGLIGVRQIRPSFGGRMAETRSQLKVRMSERLRHKNRATTPWDFEHLVLEEFPEVFKVKCFPGMVTTSRESAPGHVLVVVVPAARGDSLNPRLDAVELGRIRAFLKERASPWVHIDVRNPNYERIQIRCAVKFRTAESSGLQINRLNDALVEFISPWHEGGYQARFGWRIRSEDIRSFILGLDFVEFVTDFSILHITDDTRGIFTLSDTARFWPITHGSFRNFRRLAMALRDAQDPLSVYLREQLQPDSRDGLDRHAEAEILPREVVEGVMEDLNRVLLAGPLYEEGRFSHAVLSDDTRKRLESSPRDQQLVALNRLLLEDAYPGVFEISPARAEEIRPKYPWSIAIPVRRHWIEPRDGKSPITAEGAGIAELEVVSNFIIS